MASIIKRCDCGDWDECPHPWVVRYRTDGGRTSKQREQSFGDDLKEAEDFLLKIEHDKKARLSAEDRLARLRVDEHVAPSGPAARSAARAHPG
jgi:hypothetical protein